MFDFPATVEAIEEVPEEFRTLFVVKEGETGATLIETLRKKIDVGTGATKALDAERKARAAAEKAAGSWKSKIKELFEIETVEDLGTKWSEIEATHTKALEEARTVSGNKDEQAEKRLAQALAEKDRELAKKIKLVEDEKVKLAGEKDAMYASLDVYMRENAASQALASAKARGKILLPHVMSRTKIINNDGKYLLRVVDDDGDERVDSDGKPMTVDALVAQMRQSDDYSFAFDGDGATGSNSRSTTTTTTRNPKVNPWSKATFNATEQAKIMKANPPLAKQLEQQAKAEALA